MAHLGTAATLVYAGSSSSVQTMTVGMTVPVGSTVLGAIVWDAADGTVPSVSSIVDSRGNTYVADQSVSGESTVAILGFRAKISNALQSGDTITITIGTTRIRWVARVEAFDDILQAYGVSPLDVTANHPSNSSATLESGTTGITSQDVMLAFVAHGLGIGRTYTAPGGWTEQPAVETSNGTADRAVKILFKYTDTIGIQSASTGISPSGTNVGIIMTYRVATGSNNYAKVEHRAEGIAAGTALTTSNTGDAAGVAYSLVNGTVTSNSATGVVGGTRSMAHSVSSQSTAGGRDTTSVGASRVVRGRGYFRLPSTPAANMGFIQALNGNSAAIRVQLSTSNTVRVVDSTFTQMATVATTIPYNQVCRAEWRFVASTTAGQVNLKIWFDPASTGTPDINLSSAASFNTLAYFDGYDTGIQFSASQTYSTVYTDEVVWTVDDAAEIGKYANPPAYSWNFDGASPLSGFDATGNAVVSSAAGHGTNGVRLDARTVSGFLKQSYLTFGTGHRWASLAGWFRQPLGSLTSNCAVTRFRNTDPATSGTGGNGDIWIDNSTGYIKADLLGAKAMTGTGNVTTTTSLSATGLTGNKPANVQDYDLLWAVFFHRNGGGTITAPAGWTIHKTEAGNGIFCFATKPIPSAAAESATTYAFSNNQGSNRCFLQIGRIVGANLSSPVDAVGATSVYTGYTALVMPSITASVPKTLLLAVGTNNVGTATVCSFTSPPGMTEVVQTSVNSGSATSDGQVSQEFLASSGATGTRTAAISPTAGNSAGFLVNIKSSSLAGSTNLSNTWFYLQSVCGFKDDGSSFLKMKVNGTEVGQMTSGIPVIGEALQAVVLGSQSVADAVLDVDSLQITVSDSQLDYIGDATSPGLYVLSGGSWMPATAYVRSGGSWVVTTTPYVRVAGSWLAAT